MINKFSLIALLAVSSTTAFSATAAIGSDITKSMAEWVSPANRPQSPDDMTYAADGNSYFALSDDGRRVERYGITDGKLIETVLDLGHTRENTIADMEGFKMSADESKILVWRESSSVYRRSFTAEYYVYEVRSRLLKPLSTEHPRQQSPVFAPGARMVAFVADNNIYVKKLDYNTEVAVTTDGSAGKIINGIPDWVYEEEFTTTCSMAWSPDDLLLCYIKYDESEVPTYDMQRYGDVNSPSSVTLYPSTWNYKYPVAGEANSKVSLHCYDIETRKTTDIALPDNRIEYLPRIEFGPDAATLVVAALNRDQNLYRIYKVNPRSTVAREMYEEESTSWINPVSYEHLKVTDKGFVVNSWRDGTNKLYVYNYNGVQTSQPATGEGDVTEYYGTDAAGNVYFQAAYPTPLDRTVRRLDVKGRITDLHEAGGTASATFSPDMRYLTLRYENSAKAPTYTVMTSAGKSLRVIEDNAAYAARYEGKIAKREFFQMQSNGVTLNGYIIKPHDFDPSRRYPVVMYQYSGPGSQQVLNSWQVDWMDCFARNGYAVICVDGRGTGGRGREFCDIVYRQLGKYETEDQIAAANYAASLPWVDSKRIAIFGWSYGGYEALMAATAAYAPYKAAVAVAPVTDWRLYDTVYAERYMLTPQQNDGGYSASAPLDRVDELNCNLLIMYGTSDDNVHPANTLDFVSRLQRAGGLCDMFVFPDMNHSINYGNARAVVYAKMLQWLNANL